MKKNAKILLLVVLVVAFTTTALATDPNFEPQYSTNHIYRNLDVDQSLEWDLQTIEGDIDTLQSHTHANATTTASGFMSAADKTKLDGINPSNYASATHDHDTVYSLLNHNHNSSYAALNHNHNSDYAALEHNHNNTYSLIDHNHNTAYAALEHNHNNIYYTETEVTNFLSGKLNSSAYTASDVLTKIKTVDGTNSGLDSDTLDGNHASAFAVANHNHDNDYLSSEGGTLEGNLNVNGVIRANGSQAFFMSGQTATIGTTNATTSVTLAAGTNSIVYIQGNTLRTAHVLPRTSGTFTSGNANARWSGIFSTSAVNVSSDKRLKENIKEVNNKENAEFIKNIKIVNYNYIGKDKEKMGITAQQLIEADPEKAKYFVEIDDKGYYGVTSADLVYPLISALQELQNEVDELKKQLKK